MDRASHPEWRRGPRAPKLDRQQHAFATDCVRADCRICSKRATLRLYRMSAALRAVMAMGRRQEAGWSAPGPPTANPAMRDDTKGRSGRWIAVGRSARPGLLW